MAAHLRRQSSLEGFFFVSEPGNLGPELNAQAADIFARLVRFFQSTEDTGTSASYKQGTIRSYKKVTLLSHMYDEIQSKPEFLCYMFTFVEKSSFNIAKDEDLDLSLAILRHKHFETSDQLQQMQLKNSLFAFAEHLMDAFFLPMKAAGATPILSSATPAVVPRTDIPAVEQRDLNLRLTCLRRDGHRCVVTQKFDGLTAVDRFNQDGDNARDDDGNRLLLSKVDQVEVDDVEVAHIIPYSLASQNAKEKRDIEERKTHIAVHILQMFDPSIVPLIEGPGINRAYNAISLIHFAHRMFGALHIYFDPTEEKHTYMIRSWKPAIGLMFKLPIKRAIRLAPNRDIDPPSPDLLAIHRAVGQILHLSGAGDYIDDILRDMETVHVIAEDGSTDLGSYVSAHLGGWAEVSALG